MGDSLSRFPWRQFTAFLIDLSSSCERFVMVVTDPSRGWRGSVQGARLKVTPSEEIAAHSSQNNERGTLV
jgi:hypothetical protein